MKTANEAVRLDKWLWAARFYKTRSIARNMVDGGKVHYNGQRSKPSKIVELGAVITLRQGNEEKDGDYRENLCPSRWSSDRSNPL